MFILKWGVITGLSLWDRAGDETERERGERDGGKCASIIWRALRISCCGLGVGHYVSSHLENMELNTLRSEWNCIWCCSAQKWCRKHTEKQREDVTLSDVRLAKSDESLVGLVMKSAATVSTLSSVLRGKSWPMLPEFRAKASGLSGLSVYSSLTLILCSESASLRIQRPELDMTDNSQAHPLNYCCYLVKLSIWNL